ncbi:BppU family phage baseplate upper protein [Enterococcus faecium]|uniref:BppU family phage baseplate upper protein n=1 Tax=Enterococcus faecium TaxID=1352 RepID=UPI002542733C|nr:BppU family phage baseplate upper protein [Enterococcus faecium]MDK4444161.1 BppU family phage baseplate upper protein [Enterococcus faecium]
MVYKMNESIIVIQAEATSPNRTNVVFWSHDRGTAKLKFKLMKNNLPLPIPDGTTVPIRLMFKSATAEGGYGKHDYLATIEDPVNGIVSIVLEDNILGYVGTVEGSIYIDFPNDRSLDTAGRFTFYIKRSPIDDSTPELEDYYFNGFSQTIDKIEKILADGKLEIEQKIAESETQIDAKVKDTNDKITKANQDVATLNTNIDKANDRIDQTNQQIGDLGKLKKMYSNSIDFGNYDYSGRPNLASNLDFSKLSKSSSAFITPEPFVQDQGTHFTVMLTHESAVGKNLNVFMPNFARLEKGATYIISIPMMISSDFIISKGAMYYTTETKDPAQTYRPVAIQATEESRGKWAVVQKAFTVPSNHPDGDRNYLYFYQNPDCPGEISIGYDIKIERVNSASDQATPFQPNLLDAPYYLSKVALGENIANKSVAFPIKSSAYEIYKGNTEEDLVIGQTYTITLKGTKPASQTFVAFNTWNVKLGELKPVEGLSDVWSLTFTPTDVDSSSPKDLRIYQNPESTVGPCQIDWFKIEKGNTRTPNISQFKYFGEGLKDSNNPNDYSWDVTPEYTEKSLNNTVSLTEPQSVEGLKNFEDGLQIAGKEVATVPEDTGWVNLTAINGHSWNKQGQIRRIGKLVMFRGSLKGSTLSTQDFCTIPEGFRPSNPTDNYEYQFLLPPQSSNTLDNGGMAYIRPNGVCGLPSFRGTVNLFLAPIQYYID